MKSAPAGRHCVHRVVRGTASDGNSEAFASELPRHIGIPGGHDDTREQRRRQWWRWWQEGWRRQRGRWFM